MSREILFRGKRIDNGEWIEGSFVKYTDYDGDKVYLIYASNGNPNDIIPETLGQYTGLTDKNGKKIFEGDIVKAIQTEYDEDKEQEPIVFEVIGEMIFEDGCFGLRAKHFVDFYAPMWQEDNVELKVIGNIHDNKELLGENK